MKSDPQQPADLLHLLRQQLLLAQARLMELEDLRDTLTPRLAETERLLADAQLLAGHQTDAAHHAGRVQAALQAEFDHLRHVQHVTNEALAAARAEGADFASRNVVLLGELATSQALATQLAATEAEQRATLDDMQLACERLLRESTSQLARIAQLDAEQRALKASRSWRWTAWLRALERRFK